MFWPSTFYLINYIVIMKIKKKKKNIPIKVKICSYTCVFDSLKNYGHNFREENDEKVWEGGGGGGEKKKGKK